MESETKEILNMLLEEFQNVKTEVKQNTAETRELRNETRELRGIIETEIRHILLI